MLGTIIRKIFGKETVKPADEITILYGSHSGNSTYIARETQSYLKKSGLGSRVVNMARYDVKNLAAEKLVLIVVSTHGEGDPPDSALKFYKNLFAEDAPDLSELEFSVCALGDSSYDLFCKTGKDIDARLEELGACRLYKRVDCDVEFHSAAASWISGLYSSYSGKETDATETVEMHENNSLAVFQASIKSKYLLNEGSDSETYHVELAVDDPEFSYQAGDSLSIVPQNQPALVEALLQKMKFDGSTLVALRGKEVSLEAFLLKEAELTTLSKGLMQRYLKLTGNERLQRLVDNESELNTYVHEHDVLDLVTEFPFSGKAEAFAGVLRKVQARLYSISSAFSKESGNVNLTVKLVQYEKHGRMRNGACSTYLSNWLEVGRKLQISVVPNDLFRFPVDSSPVIMIATGTGIAPFRALMKEDEQSGIRRKCWLFFGEKYRQYDFFYEKEWEQLLNRECLTRLSLAFSRDQKKKIYIQHKILRQDSHFYRWLKQGAHLYICGSVAMGRDVQQAVCRVVQSAGEKSEAEALRYWDRMIEDNRIHLDVY